jgi:uncharacterized membrane protein YvbJ
MQCPQCQTENRSEAKFCNECGAKLEVPCPQCGNHNRPGSKFCDGCGHNLSFLQEKSSPAPLLDEKIKKIQKYLPQGLTEKSNYIMSPCNLEL